MQAIRKNNFHIGQIVDVPMRPIPPMQVLSIVYDIDNQMHVYSVVDDILSPNFIITEISESEIRAVENPVSKVQVTNTLEYERGFYEASATIMDEICHRICHRADEIKQIELPGAFLFARQFARQFDRLLESVGRMKRECSARIIAFDV